MNKFYKIKGDIKKIRKFLIDNNFEELINRNTEGEKSCVIGYYFNNPNYRYHAWTFWEQNDSIPFGGGQDRISFKDFKSLIIKKWETQ